MTNGEVIGPYSLLGDEPLYEAFWKWAEKVYNPEEIETLKGYADLQGSEYWDFFMSNIYKLPPGRPQPDKFGIDEDDWRVLEYFGGSPRRLEQELRTWMGTGKINQFQARDIWEEVAQRTRQTQLEFLYPSQIKSREERDKARVEELRATDRRGVAGIPEWQLERWKQRVEKGEITQEAVSSYIDRREASQERASQRRRQQAQWRFQPPRPEFGAAFEETRTGIGGTLPFQDWFGSRFPSILARFQATLPKLTQAGFPGLTPREAEKEIEQSWAETLRRRTPELREEYVTRFPFGGERYPSRFAPRITTVGF